jgi:hypothetical protein
VCVALGSRSFDSDLLYVLLSGLGRPAQAGPWGCAPSERNFRSRDLGDHHEHVVSGDDTRGDEVVVDLDKQRLLELVLAGLEGGDLHDQQPLRIRHAELAKLAV